MQLGGGKYLFPRALTFLPCPWSLCSALGCWHRPNGIWVKVTLVSLILCIICQGWLEVWTFAVEFLKLVNHGLLCWLQIWLSAVQGEGTVHGRVQLSWVQYFDLFHHGLVFFLVLCEQYFFALVFSQLTQKRINWILIWQLEGGNSNCISISK